MPPKGQRHPGYGLVFFPALQQDTTQLVTGAGASAILFTDAGSGKETFSGSGASAVAFTDAGSGTETFTGTGASAVRFIDDGIGLVLNPITGSGASLVAFSDVGAGNVAGDTVFAGGGGGGGFRWKWEPKKPEPRKKRKKKRALPAIEYHGADEAPARPRAPVDPVVLDRALFAVLPETGRIAYPARQQVRAQLQAEIRWHKEHDVRGLGASAIVLRGAGRGEIIPAEVMSMMRLLVEFQEQ